MNKDLIEEFLNEEVNPILDLHAGSVQVIGFDEETSTVTLRLLGGCVGCPSSQLTLYNGIVPRLEEQFPGIQVELG